MMGWWAKSFDGRGQGLGPNMPLPQRRVTKDGTTPTKAYKDTRRGIHVSWPALIEPVALSAVEARSQPAVSNSALMHVPGPIWVPLQTSTSDALKEPEMIDDDAEFISIEQLNALRNAPKSTTNPKKKRKKNEYEFLGKWFIKDLAEIRNDVLQPPGLKAGKKIELID